MAVSIGPKGYLDLVPVDEGPQRKVRIVSFVARGDTGVVVHDHFVVGNSAAAIIDVDNGELVTNSFKTQVSAAHAIRAQSDTGLATAVSGHTCWAVFTDTGVTPVT